MTVRLDRTHCHNEICRSRPPSIRKNVDLLLSGHLLGMDLSVEGNRISNIDMRGTIGAAIKFDINPWFH